MTTDTLLTNETANTSADQAAKAGDGKGDTGAAPDANKGDQGQDGGTAKNDTPENKQGEGAKTDENPEGKKDEKAKGEPLDLSDMELPEGVTISKDMLAELGAVAGELGLTKENTAKLLPLGQKMAQEMATRQNDAYNATRTEWRDQVAADKDIGGAENLAIASKALQTYGTPELRKLLNDTGLGDNPEIIRVFHKIGKTLQEDTIEKGGSGSKPNPLDALYPTMKKTA